jgi:hypothetical protein
MSLLRFKSAGRTASRHSTSRLASSLLGLTPRFFVMNMRGDIPSVTHASQPAVYRLAPSRWVFRGALVVVCGIGRATYIRHDVEFDEVFVGGGSM